MAICPHADAWRFRHAISQIAVPWTNCRPQYLGHQKRHLPVSAPRPWVRFVLRVHQPALAISSRLSVSSGGAQGRGSATSMLVDCRTVALRSGRGLKRLKNAYGPPDERR